MIVRDREERKEGVGHRMTVVVKEKAMVGQLEGVRMRAVKKGKG